MLENKYIHLEIEVLLELLVNNTKELLKALETRADPKEVAQKRNEVQLIQDAIKEQRTEAVRRN